MDLIKILQKSDNVVSMSSAKRLICMEAVKVNGILATDMMMDIKPGDEIQVGKKEKFKVTANLFMPFVEELERLD